MIIPNKFLIAFHCLCAHDLTTTLEQLQGMISQEERGAYLVFDSADVHVALGKDGDLWDQMAMRELIQLNVCKSVSLPYNALNGHRPEDRWAEEAFRGVREELANWYAPFAKGLLSTKDRNRCVDFLEFLRKQNLVLIGDLPQETKEVVFGSIPNVTQNLAPGMRQILSHIGYNHPSDEKYTVVVLVTKPNEKRLVKELLDGSDPVFVIDLSCLRESLCNWPAKTWKEWLKKGNKIKVLFTSALIPYKFEERKREYIRCLEMLKGFGLDVYVVESGGFTPTSFFEKHCSHVFYANTNDTSFINKGVNEARASLAGFDYFKFDDEDLIIKMTGRYYFNDDRLLRLIEEHPEIDGVASFFPDRKRGVTTGCFVLRGKYYKRMLQGLDFEKMERELIDIEWEVAHFFKQIEAEGAKIIYLDKMGITANVANVGVELW